MKNILIISIIIMITTCLSAQTAIQPTGTGGENDPYLIGSLENLYWIAVTSETWGSHFVQTAHIDASDTEYWFNREGWTPIGSDLEPFTGFYDGDGFTISSLFIDRQTESKVGLFSLIEGAELTGINLSNVDINGLSYVGGLVGDAAGSVFSESLIEYCHVQGEVSVQDIEGGGLIGRISGYSKVNGSSSNSTVTGVDYMGGLVGANNGGIITGSYSSGEVIGAGYTVGGLVGLNIDGGEIIESYSSANVNGQGFSIGGLVGLNSQSSISLSYASGEVTGGVNSDGVGGLIGENAGVVEDCYSTGFVEGVSNVGGLIGDNTGTVTDSYWDIEASGQSGPGAGTGLTTYQMLWEDSFQNWTFNENPWVIKNPNSHVREVYPFFAWQERPGEHNHAEAMVKLYQQGIRHYWESFPRLQEQGDYDYTVDLLDQLAGIVIRVEGLNALQTWLYMVWDDWNNEWVGPDELSLISRFGYKLQFADGNHHDLFVRGSRISPDTDVEMAAGSANWIGYFLPETQHFLSAIGQAQLDELTHIYAEHWSAWNDNGEWIYQTNPAPVMEYGKMYNLVTENTWSGDFRWISPYSAEPDPERALSQYFEFDDLPEYEAIFIHDIADDDDVLEVGVYAGNECLGASVFHQSYPLEIQAYTNHSHANEVLSFVIHRGERSEPRTFDAVQIRNPETGKYRTGFLRAQQRPMSVIRLGASGEYAEDVTEPEIILSQNFPNPFALGSDSRSGVTEIPFYTSQRSEVNISVYNIKGQKVKELVTGTVDAGKHTVSWNGMNEINREVSSGLYFYRLESGDKIVTRKMLLVR